MAQQQNNDRPVTKAPASPEEIGKASLSVAGLLAQYTTHEQARIIRAAATINGLETSSSKAKR